MSNHINHFYAAVSVLCGHGNIKQRLIHAFQENLEEIDDDELPVTVKQPFADLRKLMSRVAPLNGEGAIRASVRKMSVIEADECAQMMVNLHAEMVRCGDSANGTLPLPAEDRPAIPQFLLKSV